MHEHSRPCQADIQQIITRAEAKVLGLKRYFTGSPCKHGHVAERLAANGCCFSCTSIRKIKNYHDNLENSRKVGREKAKLRRALNTEAVRAYDKKRYEKRKGEEYYAKRKEYWARTKEERNAQQKRFYEKNKDALRKKIRERYKKDNSAWKTGARNRKARLRGAEGKHTVSDVSDLLLKQKGKCAYCKVNLKKGHHVDHIIAISRGGTNDRKNLQILCPTCNLSKRAKDPIDYAQQIGLLL